MSKTHFCSGLFKAEHYYGATILDPPLPLSLTFLSNMVWSFALTSLRDRRTVYVVAAIALTFSISSFVLQLESSFHLDRPEIQVQLQGDRLPIEGSSTTASVPSTTTDIPSVTKHPRLKWEDANAIPQTVMLKHKPGFTIFDNIYMLNKAWLIVTDHPSSFPPVREIIHNGDPLETPGEEREPSDKDIRVISPQQAHELFGDSAIHIPGVTFSTNEHPQFLNHYYHFVGEIMLGLWRLYSTLDPNITPSGRTSLQPVARWLFPHVPKGMWRDRARMNQFIIAAAFPFASVWGEDEWADLADSRSASKFDRLVLTDRGCVEHNTDHWREGKFAAIAFRLASSPNWWAPIRWTTLSFIGMGEKEIVSPPSRPVITYISRQMGGRRLLVADHDRLVKALRKMEKEYGYEVNIPVMEHLDRAEQLELAARTTILMGVHGNGLTHMLWMQQSPQASVFEFYIPGGYSPDYAWPAKAMGLTHYGFWNDTYFSPQNAQKWDQPEGFHGDSIPIDGDTVVRLCVDILSKK